MWQKITAIPYLKNNPDDDGRVLKKHEWIKDWNQLWAKSLWEISAFRFLLYFLINIQALPWKFQNHRDWRWGKQTCQETPYVVFFYPSFCIPVLNWNVVHPATNIYHISECDTKSRLDKCHDASHDLPFRRQKPTRTRDGSNPVVWSFGDNGAR